MARTLVLLFCLPWLAYALPQDRDLPLDVTADQAEFDELAGVAKYRGSVVLVQGSLRIEAQRLTAYLNNGAVERLVAQGEQAYFQDIPSMEQGQVTGNADTIEWLLSDESMNLVGQAVLTQAENRFSGENVTYRQSDGVIEAQGDGKQRVEMRLTPTRSEP